jgi:serine/threonine protein kinase
MVHYTASEMWTRTRASPEGPGTLRTLIRQLIEGVADCHRRNVTHRDLKPENLIVHIPTPDEVRQGGSAAKPVLKLADFGSAVNEESIRFVS